VLQSLIDAFVLRVKKSFLDEGFGDSIVPEYDARGVFLHGEDGVREYRE